LVATRSAAVTDTVLEDGAAWRTRPLAGVYPIVYFDRVMVRVREDRSVSSRACAPSGCTGGLAIANFADRDATGRDPSSAVAGGVGTARGRKGNCGESGVCRCEPQELARPRLKSFGSLARVDVGPQGRDRVERWNNAVECVVPSVALFARRCGHRGAPHSSRHEAQKDEGGV
jgi:hypothetical protein